MEVQRILQAKHAHEVIAHAEAREMAEKSRILQAEPQAKLKEITAADVAATLAFTSRREKMDKESMAIAEQLRLMQSDPLPYPQASGAAPLGSLPPHLQHTSIPSYDGFHGPNQPTSGSEVPSPTATGLAAALTSVQDSAASTIATPIMGAPHPREAVHE